MTKAWALVVFASLSCGYARGDQVELYTGGAKAGDRVPLVLLLHGYGSGPKSISHLIETLPARARVIVPHGPISVGRGWAWIEGDDDTTFALRLAAAAQPLAHLLDDEQRRHPSCGRPIVIGFSQGGFLSYALAAQEKPRVGVALPIAGYLPSELAGYASELHTYPDVAHTITDDEQRDILTALEAAVRAAGCQ